MPPAERQSTGSEAGSRAGRALACRSQLIEPALGLVKESGASSSQRQSPLEGTDRFGEILLAFPQQLNRPLQLGSGGFIIHPRHSLVDRHEAPWVAASSGCRRRASSAAIRPRMPLTNLPESGPPNVLASSMDSLIAALSGTLGR